MELEKKIDAIIEQLEEIMSLSSPETEHLRNQIDVIENEELRRKMGKVAIRSSQRYKSDKIMPQWIKLFNEIISVSN